MAVRAKMFPSNYLHTSKRCASQFSLAYSNFWLMTLLCSSSAFSAFSKLTKAGALPLVKSLYFLSSPCCRIIYTIFRMRELGACGPPPVPSPHSRFWNDDAAVLLKMHDCQVLPWKGQTAAKHTDHIIEELM